MIGFLIGFSILAGSFALIESRWPARAQPRWRRGMRTDLLYWLLGPPVSRALTGAAGLIVVVVVAAIAGVPLDKPHVLDFVHRTTWFGALPRGVQIASVIVAGDLLGYWLHRWLHRRRMWRFHAVHHSSVDLDWLSAIRGHPVDELVIRVLQIVPALAVGVEPTLLAAYVPALSLFAIALHANVSWSFGPLRYVIASPTFHRWHHTSQAAGRDKNFAGLLPVWDLMFGTFYMPHGERPREFGVSERVPDGLVGQLAWPFRSARSSSTARTGGASAPASASVPTPT